jgi:signal transduction histidine kinase
MRKRLELVGDLDLTDDQVDAIDAHSFANVAAALAALLQSLELFCQDVTSLRRCFDSVMLLGRFARSAQTIVEQDQEVGAIAEEIERAVDSTIDAAGEAPYAAEREHLAQTIRHVIAILHLRLAELVARHRVGSDVWVPHQLSELRDRLESVLTAMAEASCGRFDVSFQPGQLAANAYAISLQFSSADGQTISMPAILHDVARDLLANARKYTDPGGRLVLELTEAPSEIRLVVSDTGRGIPADEMGKVVDFGYRAANAATRRSYGGGYGLTKAYWVVRRLSGRMWIESEIDVGTIVSCIIPRPHTL